MKIILKISLLGLFVFLISACQASKNIDYLGCNWKLPNDVREAHEGRYSGISNSDEFYSVTFHSVSFDPPESDSYSLLDEFRDGKLIVKKFKSSEPTLKKMNIFHVSREGYEGNVVVTNNSYKDFISQCD